VAIRRFSGSSLTAGSKSSKLWDQETTLGTFESIATATCSGSESSVTFSNIPQGYTHLQIRYMLRTLRTAGYDFQRITFNGDTTSNYSDHLIKGNGTAASAEANNGGALIYIDYGASDFYTAGIYTVGILDILDYSNTSKYKTTRQLNGFDANGSGYVNFNSGNWRSTSAITQIDITKGYTDGFKQYSSFALYGIRGA